MMGGDVTSDLPFFHLRHSLDSHAGVGPVDIPVVFVGHFAKVKACGSAPDTVVFAHRETDEIDPERLDFRRRIRMALRGKTSCVSSLLIVAFFHRRSGMMPRTP